MCRLGFAGAEVFVVIEGRGEACEGLGQSGFHGGAEGFGIAFGAEVNDELAAFDGGLEVGGELWHKVVAHKIDDGDVAAQACIRAKCHFKMGNLRAAVLALISGSQR